VTGVARELKNVVVLDGFVYGPGYINPPPDDIAERITNPAAWGTDEDDTSNSEPQGEDETPEPVTPAPAPSAPAVPTPEPTPDADPELPDADAPPVPPRSGRGSGEAAWREFADYYQVAYPEDANRDDIIQACEDAKVI
jgi:hypothetical protein